MGSRRQERVGALLHHAIAEALIRDVKDPRLRGVTVTGVDITGDLRAARVYYRVLAGVDQPRVQTGLERAGSFIQARVGREAGLRFTPTLHFVYDPAPDRAQRVDELLRDASLERDR
jgi:ribosome-binding factor A